MKSNKNVFHFIRNVFKEKCPNCKEGAAFKKGIPLLGFPEMNETCPSCDYKFEREPGYFIGAMYLSYGLALVQGVIAYVLAQLLLPPLSVSWLLFIVISTFFLFSKKNYKWSRLLYIYIFPW
jgi:uncharacterized protein (DUF983 family)